MVFDIKRYSINDGPGIRITIFFKGCPLSCPWCHNPEGIWPGKQKMYTRAKCLGCGECIKVCPENAIHLSVEGTKTNQDKCRLCGKCAEACPSLAMEIIGKEYSIDELMEEIGKETLVMDRSGGGVTFCGGEPLMASETLLNLLKRCGDKAIHRAIDTTLYVKTSVLREIMEYTDLFLVDLKHMDAAKHQFYCETSNRVILSNLQILAENNIPFIIRIPLIEGVNADSENIRASAEFISSLPGAEKALQLLPYHDIGKGKHEKIGSIYNPTHIPMTEPSELCKQNCISIFREYGIEAVIGG